MGGYNESVKSKGMLFKSVGGYNESISKCFKNEYDKTSINKLSLHDQEIIEDL